MKIYAIKNSEGKWFVKSGGNKWFDGAWTDNFERAGLWSKIATPRAIISRLANDSYHPKQSVLVEFELSEGKEIDESERLLKAKDRKNKQIRKRRDSYRKSLVKEMDKYSDHSKEKSNLINRIDALDMNENPYYRTI